MGKTVNDARQEQDTPRGRTLITGASGFVGQHLCSYLRDQGHQLRYGIRGPDSAPRFTGLDTVAVGEVGEHTDWSPALQGIDQVVHLVARVHRVNEDARGSADAYLATNTAGTLRLAAQAAACGIKRLVFLSSAKVLGECTRGEGNPNGPKAFDESSELKPVDPYSESKARAEEGLYNLAAKTGLEVVIIRPPLVYGPGVRANFYTLMRAIDRGLPLPLGAIPNRRSLVYVGNLVSAIASALVHPKAAGQSFLVSDGVDLATPDLVRALAKHLAKPARLLPIPVTLLKLGGAMLGRPEAVQRLVSSLALDSSKLERDLGWVAPHSLEDGLRDTVAWYRQSQRAAVSRTAIMSPLPARR